MLTKNFCILDLSYCLSCQESSQEGWGMTPWHKVSSEQQGRLVTVTWRVLWHVLPGQLCRQDSHCP